MRSTDCNSVNKRTSIGSNRLNNNFLDRVNETIRKSETRSPTNINWRRSSHTCRDAINVAESLQPNDRSVAVKRETLYHGLIEAILTIDGHVRGSCTTR